MPGTDLERPELCLATGIRDRGARPLWDRRSPGSFEEVLSADPARTITADRGVPVAHRQIGSSRAVVLQVRYLFDTIEL